MPRKTFKLTPEQKEELLNAMKPVPYIIINGKRPRSQQENANDAWKKLGKELGFDGMSVQPAPGADGMYFSANVIEDK